MTRSRWLFFAFLGLLALQRLLELRLSLRNERLILAAGGREHAPRQWKVMRLLHTTWFLSMLAEVIALRRPFRPGLAALAGVFFTVGQALRYAAIRTLGPRWTVKVFTLPGVPPVTGGIYRWLRHPNYLGVILEVAAVPLLHSAWLTAIIFSLANLVLLASRIRLEEQALHEDNGYKQLFERRLRLLPQIQWTKNLTF